ncbi:MAG: hypothetical protein WCU88_05900 [Elusimicrobiota bacterium]|jgi:ABC-type transport system involved in multi-copper enzyme maturation permease subunit
MIDAFFIARHSFQEQLRGRFFLVAVLFGGLLLYMSLLLGTLAADQELRALLDFGLSAAELLATASAVFAVSSGLLRDMETKTLYLVLSRPVRRPAYLFGRWLGINAAAFCAALLMVLLHLLLLLSKGWVWEPAYAGAVCGILLKVALTSSLAALLAMVSTSTLSGLLMTAVFWTLGHFTLEMRQLLEREAWRAKLIGFTVYLVPNLGLLNFRDQWGAGSREMLAFAAGYTALYAAACLTMTAWLFRKKEF